ncbi:hypothetical protein F53441_4712 [Fusarium austroafricanum]|uniref:Nucleoside phosphorylase domain-containing protein n=1 Tax=Fusarium austroafricanum TaxID=2364996 RepID=A0A8H4P946_9HYPO|nr:hypothetical protein F53441_4712 [Fusarium austroafricanum]
MSAPPKSRDDFRIGIVCALALEHNAVSQIVDEFWDETRLGKSARDPNTYSIGRIADANVVLVLSGMGANSSLSATTRLLDSYPNLELVLVTGICGGVPDPLSGEELLLGDVVISKAVVQHDFGRRYPDSFEVKDTLDDRLGRPTRNIRNFVARLETDRARERLEDRAASLLGELQFRANEKHRAANYQYPGTNKDHLFPSSYRHKHHSNCETCSDHSVNVCHVSRKLSCRELGCDNKQLVPRSRLEKNKSLENSGRVNEAQAPFVFVGHIGSGNTVLKSGEERDRLAQAYNLIAFDMEAAGAWDDTPCIIVKGVSDYADSHKNKKWKNFAAATAAAVSRALIEQYTMADNPNKKGASDDECSRMDSGGPVFHGDVSGSNILTGFHSSGTQTFNFG